uniref:Uncharacterized protein n=1 Tax=Romanomermis culicivorax TaxID=13658 RepID=A0A915KWP7_ROMCU
IAVLRKVRFAILRIAVLSLAILSFAVVHFAVLDTRRRIKQSLRRRVRRRRYVIAVGLRGRGDVLTGAAARRAVIVIIIIGGGGRLCSGDVVNGRLRRDRRRHCGYDGVVTRAFFTGKKDFRNHRILLNYQTHFAIKSSKFYGVKRRHFR